MKLGLIAKQTLSLAVSLLVSFSAQAIQIDNTHACDPRELVATGLAEMETRNDRWGAEWLCSHSSHSQITCAKDIVYADPANKNPEGFNKAYARCVDNEIRRYTQMRASETLVLPASAEHKLDCNRQEATLEIQGRIFKIATAQSCILIQHELNSFATTCRMNFIINTTSADVVQFEKVSGNKCHVW